jgi:O-acetyl-ADP-ribose deacetylase
MRNRIEIVKADITTLDVDTIVNAANSSLLGGGGVDGAIHRAAGPELLEECRGLGGCPTGRAKITRAYKLPAKYVIHTVGPVWNGGQQGEAEMLAQCYRSSLRLAVEHSVKTIAFPAISCGIYGYPIEEACTIAIRETGGFLSREESIDKVIFACFGYDVYQAYARAMSIVYGDEE